MSAKLACEPQLLEHISACWTWETGVSALGREINRGGGRQKGWNAKPSPILERCVLVTAPPSPICAGVAPFRGVVIRLLSVTGILCNYVPITVEGSRSPGINSVQSLGFISSERG
ncbi:hypothetical protein AAFF_G00244050 [Aldrovandia affinis]|uniref:Uncharacterized protein n=1 Tax=Aldrovandia affinis TaxID=143900 RepID=A0AAD7RDN3_9TELE|nr:hypothetical protein AAFF_G00244050 [Aldrovandia affinis]